MLGNGLIMSWLCGKNFVCGIILRQNRRDTIRGKTERKQEMSSKFCAWRVMSAFLGSIVGGSEYVLG